MGKIKKLIKDNAASIYCYTFLLVVILVLNRASILGIIRPFAYPFAFAMVLAGKNAFLIGIFNLLGYILQNFTVGGVIEAISCFSALILFYLFARIFSLKSSLVLAIVFALVSQAAYVYFHISTTIMMFQTMAHLIAGMFFVHVFYQALNGIFERGMCSRLTLDENICLAMFIMAFCSGLGNLYILEANITNGLVLLIILLGSRVCSKTAIIYFSAMCGFGISLATGTAINTAIFVTYGVLAACMSDRNRFLAPVLIILADAMYGLFLNAYILYSIWFVLPLLIACVLYVCLPRKFFEKLKSYSLTYEGSIVNEYMFSGERQKMRQRLMKLSELFSQMQTAYRNLSMGEIDRKTACTPLAQQIMESHCKNCKRYNECLQNSAILSAIGQLFEFGMEKSKVSLIDANNLLTSACIELNSLIEEINELLKNYFEYEKTIKTEDTSKLVIAEQMGAGSQIFTELANHCMDDERINAKLSEAILDELTLSGVVASEVVALEGEQGLTRIIAVLKNVEVVKAGVADAIKNVCHLEFKVQSQSMAKIAGFSILVFVPAPRYSVQIGYAGQGQAADKLSGDNYGFCKISASKYLFAITDGMGHGAAANRISSSALSLIEGFYKAGFSGRTILSSVNRLLLPSGDGENFTTLDACILDLEMGVADFVKIGSSVSVIKSENTVKTIKSQSLPLGIVKKVSANAQRQILKSQDIIVLASDGVVDTFDSPDQFSCFVNNERVVNVQMLADSLLEEAESREREHHDDKTVMVIKLV